MSETKTYKVTRCDKVWKSVTLTVPADTHEDDVAEKAWDREWVPEGSRFVDLEIEEQ